MLCHDAMMLGHVMKMISFCTVLWEISKYTHRHKAIRTYRAKTMQNYEKVVKFLPNFVLKLLKLCFLFGISNFAAWRAHMYMYMHMYMKLICHSSLWAHNIFYSELSPKRNQKSLSRFLWLYSFFWYLNDSLYCCCHSLPVLHTHVFSLLKCVCAGLRWQPHRHYHHQQNPVIFICI